MSLLHCLTFISPRRKHFLLVFNVFSISSISIGTYTFLCFSIYNIVKFVDYFQITDKCTEQLTLIVKWKQVIHTFLKFTILVTRHSKCYGNLDIKFNPIVIKSKASLDLLTTHMQKVLVTIILMLLHRLFKCVIIKLIQYPMCCFSFYCV